MQRGRCARNPPSRCLSLHNPCVFRLAFLTRSYKPSHSAPGYKVCPDIPCGKDGIREGLYAPPPPLYPSLIPSPTQPLISPHLSALSLPHLDPRLFPPRHIFSWLMKRSTSMILGSTVFDSFVILGSACFPTCLSSSWLMS